MTYSSLTIYNLNTRWQYIYLGYIFIVITGLWVWVIMQDPSTDEDITWDRDTVHTGTDDSEPVEDIVAASTGRIVVASTGITVQDVPFTSQAPFSEWSDILYQEGCEEAAAIMAVAWARGKTAISPEDANTQILSIAEFEQREFWTHIHASIYDIATTMSDYLWFSDHTIVENISKSELIQYLRDRHIVMVPTSGRDLQNIYYTPPGPRNHIILIIGYDPISNEFITNDSGTKNGASYRYNEDLLFDAIGYYTTSATDSGSLVDTTRKSAIIITKVTP